MLAWSLLALYAGASCIAFLAYAVDKRAARRGLYRIPEFHLHLLSLAGGWPGAWLGQNLLRHKTQKRRFLRIFVAMVAINCIIVGLLLFFLI
jgi:uncharacterized membrane protein YsdA (DUF1294 family)